MDRGLIDGFLHLVARAVYNVGYVARRFEEVVIKGGVDWVKDQFLSMAREFRYLQTGKIQEYALISVLIAAALAAVVLLINNGWFANIF
jgi:NADH-quinone oxidoreductase subunit L